MTKLTSLTPTHIKIILYIALICFSIGIISTANAMPSPDSYGENECQKIALDYQKEFGGSLIWLQPIDKYGNPILSDYGAHVLNQVYDPVRKELRYVDYQLGWNQKADFIIHDWNDQRVKQYDLSKERPEFGLVWHH